MREYCPQRKTRLLGGDMTRSGHELAPDSSQSCTKGRNHVRILALEEVNDGYRYSETGLRKE